MNDFTVFYQDVKKRIDINLSGINWNCEENNPIIADGVERLQTMGKGGKYLRGILVYIGHQLVQDDNLSEADALAIAFELFQTAILVHDDVIDHAANRRGKETIHMQYSHKYVSCDNRDGFSEEMLEMGRSLAICLGDLGLYEAEQKLVDAYRNHEYFGELLTYYHKAIMNTIKGELLDVQLPYMERYHLWKQEQIDDKKLEKMILDIYHLKTSCYTVIGPLCCGMILGGASPALVKKMEEIGDSLGLAFQIQDDILGIYGKQDQIGKNIGSDISEYKQTLLYSYTKSEGGELYQKLREYYGKTELTIEEVKYVGEIFRKSGALDYARQKITRLFNESIQKLEEIEEISEDKKGLLLGFISYLAGREA